MAGQIIISNIKTDSDNAFSILANTGAVIFSANLASGITTNIANTRITGNIVSSQITSVSNTQITGTITAGQLATSLNLATNNVQVASIQSATGTPAITFAANGQMTLANTPLQLTGGQIKFPGTQIASGDGNTLDDYEEGTWTPTASAASGSLTAYVSSGTYTKIGRNCLVTFKVQLTTPGTGSGALVIGGFPFVCGDLGGQQVIMMVREGAATANIYHFYLNSGGTGGNMNSLTGDGPISWTTNYHYYVAGSYPTA
jgi:hypothetical protein